MTQPQKGSQEEDPGHLPAANIKKALTLLYWFFKNGFKVAKMAKYLNAESQATKREEK